MKKINILCIDDELEVLEAVVRDLAELEDTFPIETAESSEDAKKVIQELLDKQQHIGLILCDHIMPGQNGVDLLRNLHQEEFLHLSRKILLTGQASHDATIQAINHCDLNYYISKPWEKDDLLKIAKNQLTEYIIQNHLNPTPYMTILNQARLSEAIRKGDLLSDT